MTFRSKRRSACRVSLLGVEKPNGPLFNSGVLFNCEFDSFRIWPAGEGPPPNKYNLHVPVYEAEFSTPDPNWLFPDNGTLHTFIRDGALHLKYRGGSWRLWGEGNIPAITNADIEVVGRAASSGSWGLSLLDYEQQRSGILIALDPSGQVNAWRIDVVSLANRNGKLTAIPITGSRIPPSWKGDTEFNTLRAHLDNQSLTITVNGETVCDDIALPKATRPMYLEVAGYNVEKPVDCEFDSIRVWRAGDGLSRPMERIS